MIDILIFGTGGHAKVVLDTIILEGKFKVHGFVTNTLDENNSTFQNYPIFKEEEDLLKSIPFGIIAVGDNWTRSLLANNILKKNSNFEFINTIHPFSHLSPSATLGIGNFIGPFVSIGPDSIIENHCLLNTKSSLDHDCYLKNFTSIGPGAICGGNVTIGECSAISLGVKIIHNINVGNNSVIGAGATVLENMPSNCVAFGVPCKKTKDREASDKYL